MKTPSLLNAKLGIPFQLAATCVALLGAAGPAEAVNVLIDPSFESPPLGNYITVYSTFTTGVWGTENGTLVGTVGGVSPYQGALMLSMTSAGGSATQTVQITDVSANASTIDLSMATYDLSAMFNAGIAGTTAQVSARFFDAAQVAIGNPTFGGLALDASGRTWESIAIQGVIPVGTRWIASEVLYGNSSLGTDAGYVDSASLTITIPEPSSCGLLGLGICGLLIRRRR